MEDRTVIDSQMPPMGGGGAEATFILTPGAPPPGAMPGGYEATQQAMVTTCPVCGTPNGPAERYCQDCGLMMGSAVNVEPLPDLSSLPRLTDNAGRDFALNPGPNTVGRDAADVLIPDPTISRRHAVLHLENGQVFAEDQGSTNGTSVAGRKLAPGERASVMNGDTVKFGNVILTLALPGGAARAATAAAPATPAAPVASPAPPADRGAPVAALVLADGTEYPLFEGVNTVGRRSGNQIVLPDAFMSGKHAEIHVDASGAAKLVDVGSTNGSFLNGQRLAAQAPVELADGTQFTMGKTPVTLRVGGGAPAPAETTVMLDAPPAGEEPASWDTQTVSG